jgi:hypothetical protein
MSDVKPATTLKELLKPPFHHDGTPTSMVYDGNSRLLDIRGWGFFQYYENGEQLQDEFKEFVVQALNEKWEREKPHDPGEGKGVIRTGIERIAAERKRQIEEEGFTAEYEDQWQMGELIKSAVWHLYPGEKKNKLEQICRHWAAKGLESSPDNRIREMEKAGARIAAEIDRLLRLEVKL